MRDMAGVNENRGQRGNQREIGRFKELFNETSVGVAGARTTFAAFAAALGILVFWRGAIAAAATIGGAFVVFGLLRPSPGRGAT